MSPSSVETAGSEADSDRERRVGEWRQLLKAVAAFGLGNELFVEDAFFKIVFRIEQQTHGDIRCLFDLDFGDVAEFGVVGDGADRPLGCHQALSI